MSLRTLLPLARTEPKIDFDVLIDKTLIARILAGESK